MGDMGLTSKGQVTIPIEVRKKLKLKPGDRVRFVEENGQIVLKPVLKDIRAAFGSIAAPAHVKRYPTQEEIDEAVADSAVERFQRAVR